MIKPLFTPEMFKVTNYGTYLEPSAFKQMADLANKIYMDHLTKNGVELFGHKNDVVCYFQDTKFDAISHRGILIEIEPLVKEKCEHSVANVVTKLVRGVAHCWKCGVEIESTGWKEIK